MGRWETLLWACGLTLASLSFAAASEIQCSVKSLDGQPVDLAKQYQGQVLLIVNVASKCGLTPHYEGLQALYTKYRAKGLRVLAFPCNQFGQQEPGSAAEIRDFCTGKYHVTFDLFEKIDVNGDGASPLYKRLTAVDVKPAGAGKISWNFEKFLIGRDGQVVARFAPRTKPDDPALVQALEAALGKLRCRL